MAVLTSRYIHMYIQPDDRMLQSTICWAGRLTSRWCSQANKNEVQYRGHGNLLQLVHEMGPKLFTAVGTGKHLRQDLIKETSLQYHDMMTNAEALTAAAANFVHLG